VEFDPPEAYLPSQQEIRAACLEFQASWSHKDERQRAGGREVVEFSDWYDRDLSPRITRPVVRVQSGKLHGLRGVSSWQG